MRSFKIKMKGIVFLVMGLLSTTLLWAQEINCEVTVEARRTGKTQLTIFNTLEKEIASFVNNTRWTNKSLPKGQRVKCKLFLTIDSYRGNAFSGTLQIQSSRPVYGANFETPLFNYKDNRLSFRYEENQPLNYNPDLFESNLVSIISFYANIILGLDADSFSSNGGAGYFETARKIANTAQQNGQPGWELGNRDSRQMLGRELVAPNLSDFHEAIYQYHRLGLDEMAQDMVKGKANIEQAIMSLKKANETEANTMVIRTFFDAKANELGQIFSGGPEIKRSREELMNALNSLAPRYSAVWQNIQ